MASGLVGLPVRPNIGSQLRQGAETDGDKHSMTELADRGKGIRAVGSDADLRPWLLIGFRGQSHVVKFVEFARIGERIFGPRPFEDFESLGEALPALAIRDTIRFISTREPAAPDAEDKPTMTDLIDRRSLLADP